MLLLQFLMTAVTVYRGRRRKFKDDHPHCRHCGYDLFGQPAPLLICNECGLSLSAKGSVVVGFKPRKPGLILIVITLLLFPCVYVGDNVYFWMRAGNWIPYAPTNWVISSTGSKDFMKQQNAMAEVTRRIASQTLTDAQWEAIAQAAIADRSQPVDFWDIGWQPIMKTAWVGHHLSDSTRQKYRNCLITKIRTTDFGHGLLVRDELEKLDACP